MSDPFRTLAGILTDVSKGRGLMPRVGLGRSMNLRIADLVKEGMTYFSEIDPEASFEWVREDISNYNPDQIQDLLIEIQKVWKKETWDFARETYNAVPLSPQAGCDDCEIDLEEAVSK